MISTAAVQSYSLVRPLVQQLRSQGQSWRAIAVELNRRGYRTRRGKLWHRVQVERVLAHSMDANRRRPLDFMGRGKTPKPTHALPGSPEKILAMSVRALRGQQLFHPDDGAYSESLRIAFTGALDNFGNVTNRQAVSERRAA